jgi:serine/threonine protein kinase/CheY-like chemotaxis protein
MMAENSDDPRLGTVIAGYRIEERIGRGGMGVVYRAQHLNLQRRAAIKIIAPDLAESEGFRERFTREARIAAALQHPNIVTVYDAGEVDGMLYLAMQFIQGEDLAAILRRDGRLRPYRAIDVCRQVASALDAAHAMGLIHRDVKPANVLIEGRNAFLTDFGLTKQAGTNAQLTRAGDMVGTIHYVAPEQIEGRRVSARSDVYALGCLLYHSLSGQVPFAHETDVAVIYAHLSEQPPKLSELRPELPEGLDAVMAKALDKRPDRRFPSCGDMISAARAVIDAAGPLSETIPPRPSQVVTPAPAEIRDAAEAARRPRVLLGGLDDQTRAVARVALGDRVDVLEAPAQATADRAREERPDLVILDWAGVGRAGIEALRSDALTRDAKVLLLTDGRGSRDAVGAGADDRLAAPFSPLQLQVKLRRLLGAEVI